MTNLDDGAFLLEMRHTFDAAPERVFDAWLDKSWGDWAGPPGVKGEVVQLEPRVGGGYKIVMHSERGELTVSGTYKEIVRPSRLVMSWKWAHEDADTLVTLTFQPHGEGTVMHMRHEGFNHAERRDSHVSGWDGTFEKLAQFLAA